TQKKIIPWVGNEYSRVLENKNRLLATYEGANGGKTGYTSKAGRCLVFSAKRGETELIGVVLNCPTWFDTAERMLDFGFEHYAAETFLQAGQNVGAAGVKGGVKDSVNAISEKRISAALAHNETPDLEIHIEQQNAPVFAGQTVGRVRLISGGDILDECALLAADDVAEKHFFSSLARIIRRWAAF
ncbi:MAG: D-alanyl-D-alanine carboxypeptidase, partial [Clostridia bacterium]|nr:D-alanyl-D-alanine carboxypeptidase [Clostridia bacterium]